jgi:hypothetical protein
MTGPSFPKTKGDRKALDDKFQAILQLLLLLNTLIENPKLEPEDNHNATCHTIESRKAFDYLDAITNLMVRDIEVVAAVACGGPSMGLISVNSPIETRSDEQVRPQSTSYV